MSRRRPQLQLPYNDGNLGPLFERREEPAPTAPSRVVQDFAERREARLERMRARAARLERESDASRARRQQIGDRIPMGQPILVGHHSERRHRKDIERIDSLMRKQVESHREAEDVKRRVRAAEAGRGGISSDDPEAVRLLREKLAKAEDLRDKTIALNKIIRKGGSDETILATLHDLGWRDPARGLAALRSMGQQTISTTNASAEIRRIKARIEELTKRRAEPARAEEAFGEVRVDEEGNRVRLFFPSKPSATIRDELKGSGFRWSPTAGAWQRMSSNQAWHEARRIAEKAGGSSRDRARRGTSRRDPARKTPGYRTHLRIAFTADKRGRPVAYAWNGRFAVGAFGGRWVRFPLDEARILVASGDATRVPYASQANASRASSARDPGARLCPVGTRVQSLILYKVRFDRVGAINWVVDNGHRARKIDETSASYRFRQEEPSSFVEGSFRTIDIGPGVKAVIGCPRS